MELFFVATHFHSFFFQLLRNHSYPSHLCHFSFHLSRAECSNKLSLFFLSWKRWDSLVSNTSGCGTEKRRDLGEPPGWHSDADRFGFQLDNALWKQDCWSTWDNIDWSTNQFSGWPSCSCCVASEDAWRVNATLSSIHSVWLITNPHQGMDERQHSGM